MSSSSPGLPNDTNMASQHSPPERPLPLDVLPDAPDLVVEVAEKSSSAGAALVVGVATLGSLVSHPGVLVLGGDEIIVQGVPSTRGQDWVDYDLGALPCCTAAQPLPASS